MQSFLQPLKPVLLEIPKGDSAGRYPSVVLDFRKGEEIGIGVPIWKGYEIRVDPGTEITVQSSQSDGLRRFTSTVLRREGGNSPCLFLAWPETVERLQRREYVRVEVMIRVEGRDREEPPRILEGVTTDLSAGGARLALSEALDSGKSLELTLYLPAIGERGCSARVVRSGENERAAKERRHWAAIEFTEIPATVHKDLTRFLLDVQRDQIRKGVT